MCGIVGFVGGGDQNIIEKMMHSIHHRGPDDGGFFHKENIWLGHRRLSILDLSPLGHQPMESLSRQTVIVFNGEIYNFQELKKELEKKGYAFRGGSDTEIILALYEEEGTESFKKMDGMFALALYDKKTGRLVLARDRMGKKPLYYACLENGICFGSELKALLEHPQIKKEIDLQSFAEYLSFDAVFTPHSIFKNIQKLEPGHFLVFEKGNISKEKFWDIEFGKETVWTGVDHEEKNILQEMDARLQKAVESRLVADVPIGIFLSGGLDSSTIAYYAQKLSGKKIETFSIGFEEKSYDESLFAREVASFLGTDHHEHILKAHEALDIIPKVADIIDEPVADYSFVPTYLLSKFTKESVTVALGGDGGDELFFGYPTFQAEKMLQYMRKNEAFMKRVVNSVAAVLPSSNKHFNLKFKLERLVAGLNTTPGHRHHSWMGTFAPDSLFELVHPDIKEEIKKTNPFVQLDAYEKQIAHLPRWNQLIYLYCRTYLMDQVLVKVDRSSMAASLEVRAPFLDYRFVDFVNSIDSRYKLRGFETKYLLKKLMEDKLPSSIVYRKKQGFAVPLSFWFRHELKDFVHDILSKEALEKVGYFDVGAVERLVKDHMEGKADRRKQIWSLIVWQLWYNRWVQ